MKIQIPDALKAAMPEGMWGKMLLATPVVMTVLATMLAGLASSEMTRAQYARSLAAQQQSKAGDQWGYFQAKRLRGTALKTAGDMLRVTNEVARFDLAALQAAAKRLPSDVARLDELAKGLRDAATDAEKGDKALVAFLDVHLQHRAQRAEAARQLAAELAAAASGPAAEAAMTMVCTGDVGRLSVPEAVAGIKAAQDAIEGGRSAAEVALLLAEVTDAQVEQALAEGREQVRAFDAKVGPANRLCDQLDGLFSRWADLVQETRSAMRSLPESAATVGNGLRFTACHGLESAWRSSGRRRRYSAISPRRA